MTWQEHDSAASCGNRQQLGCIHDEAVGALTADDIALATWAGR